MKNLKFDIFSIIFLAEISRLALTVTKIERLNLIHNFLLKDFIFVLQENYFILFLRHQCVAHLYKIVYYLSDYYKGYVTKNNSKKKMHQIIFLWNKLSKADWDRCLGVWKEVLPFFISLRKSNHCGDKKKQIYSHFCTLISFILRYYY